jgi:hypothetical protein
MVPASPARALGALGVVVVAVGCARAPLQLRGEPRPGPARAVPEATCQVDLLEARDARAYPETLGTIAGRVVRSPADPTRWLEGVLAGLAAQGIAVARVPAPRPASALALTAELRDAWVGSLSTAKTATAIVTVRFLVAGAEPVDKTYRGRDTSGNWASGDGEIEAMMERVFRDILGQLGADLAPFCGP